MKKILFLVAVSLMAVAPNAFAKTIIRCSSPGVIAGGKSYTVEEQYTTHGAFYAVHVFQALAPNVEMPSLRFHQSQVDITYNKTTNTVAAFRTKANVTNARVNIVVAGRESSILVASNPPNAIMDTDKRSNMICTGGK